jgi:hypothetical protein
MSKVAKDVVRIDHVIGSGWIHTHGMAAEGYPELEIMRIPLFLGKPASVLLYDVCDYMLRTGRRVKAGETMAASSGAVFRFERPEPMPSCENHYQLERLQIVDLEASCDCCGTVPPRGLESQPPLTADDTGDGDWAPHHTAEVVLEDPDDPEAGMRVAGLAERHGGESLGRHETVLSEEVEVEEFGFESREAAEAFARACETEAGVRDVWTTADE